MQARLDVPGKAPSGPPVVLLVEDNTDIREVFAAFLEESGFAVVHAADGDTALSLLSAGVAPDLILLDLIMPNMNGWCFLQRRQQAAGLSSIPLVVISGAPQSGADPGLPRIDGYLKKPIRLEELLSTVQAHARH
jgi:CheY-like chemotaxis protein